MALHGPTDNKSLEDPENPASPLEQHSSCSITPSLWYLQKLTCIECLLCARHCSSPFTCIHHLFFTILLVLWPGSFPTWEKGGPEKLSNLPKVTWLGGKTRTPTQAASLWKPSSPVQCPVASPGLCSLSLKPQNPPSTQRSTMNALSPPACRGRAHRFGTQVFLSILGINQIDLSLGAPGKFPARC